MSKPVLKFRRKRFLPTSPLPSAWQRQLAIEAIRSLDTKYFTHGAKRAALDDYPRDIASRTALYLGVAIDRMWSHMRPAVRAVIAGIPVADAHEFAELVELANHSKWIDDHIVACAIAALQTPAAAACSAPPEPVKKSALVTAESADAATADWTLPLHEPGRTAADVPPARRAFSQRATSDVMYSTPLPRVQIAAPDKAAPVCDDPTGPVKLLDLKHHHCRWPIGDPRSPEFGFCGARAVPGRVYCAEHRERARAKVAP